MNFPDYWAAVFGDETPAQVAARLPPSERRAPALSCWLSDQEESNGLGNVGDCHLQAIQAIRATMETTKATERPVTLKAAPAQAEAWGSAAARAGMSRQAWSKAVLDVAAGASDLAEQLDRVRGDR